MSVRGTRNIVTSATTKTPILILNVAIILFK